MKASKLNINRTTQRLGYSLYSFVGIAATIGDTHFLGRKLIKIQKMPEGRNWFDLERAQRRESLKYPGEGLNKKPMSPEQ
jgi:hypothetical protein